MITEITEQDENDLDANKPITLVRGTKSFTIEPSSVYCYGEIDFSSGSEDLEVISTFTWLDHRVLRGIVIPSNYDYDNNVIMADNDGIIRYYDTVRPEKVAKYFHGRLNKPQRTIIFKHIYGN